MDESRDRLNTTHLGRRSQEERSPPSYFVCLAFLNIPHVIRQLQVDRKGDDKYDERDKTLTV